MAGTYISYSSRNGGGVQTYASFANLPATAADGTLALTLDTDTLYVFNLGSMTWIVLASGGGTVVSMGALDGNGASANGASINLNTLYMQSASATFPGLVNTGVQSFAGAKTFTGAISASNLSGTNTGDVTLGTASGLSLAGQVLSLQLSDATHTGALSSTDWSTFNSKQTAGSYITALTGDVTASGPGSAAATIAANAVTNAKLAQMAAHTFKGNNTGALGNALDLTQAQLTADLNLFTSVLQGLVPASGGGTVNFLRADGTFAAPAGSGGTVTSVALADGSSTPIYTITGSPVTSSGTLTFSLQTQTANKVFAGPASAGPSQPTFRSLVAADLPTANLTAAGTDGISVTGGTGAVIGAGTSIQQQAATTSLNGYLTSTDWNTFNNKQAAISIGALDAQAANANGLSFVANVLSQQSATASFPGLVNITSQTFGGTKTFAQIIDSGLTADTVIYANGSKQLTSSSVSSAELSYLSGVTAPIQTQLAGKQAINPGDIPDTSFAAANNVSSPANVTGFAFANSTVRSFKALVSIFIDATSDSYETMTLNGIQKGSSWDMSISGGAGDLSGIAFTITTAGQIQYTSPNSSGFVSSTIRFRAWTTQV